YITLGESLALHKIRSPGQAIRDDRLCRKQENAGEQQVPPDRLSPFRLLRRYGRSRTLVDLRHCPAGCRRDELPRIHGGQIRLRRIEIDRDSRARLQPRVDASGPNLVESLLLELDESHRIRAAQRDAL